VCVLPASHPLASRAVLTPQDFADQSFVSLSASDPYRLILDKMFAEFAVSRRMTLETQSAASVCCLVREGLGIAIVNPLTAIEHASQGLAVRRLGVSIPFIVTLVRPRHRPSNPSAEGFVTALREQIGDIRHALAQLPGEPPHPTA
jgi:DNA-binding transcriptional LysR family regulator